MRDDFCIFILTHGRPANQKTFHTLKKIGYSGKVYFVIDNEDKTADLYYQRFGENNVIMFDKLEISKRLDEMDNFNDRRAILYARNACFEIAKKIGIKYFLELDDDYTDFISINRKTGKRKSVHSFDKICEIMIEWLESSPIYKSVAFMQAGDLIGGTKNGYWIKGFKRKAMNTFFCSVERPFNFLGRINEDVNTYTSLGFRGNLFLSTASVLMIQIETQANKGGMTDIYLASGTYVKSFYSVMCSPSSVVCKAMHCANPRIHHEVDQEKTYPKIIREKYKKEMIFQKLTSGRL